MTPRPWFMPAGWLAAAIALGPMATGVTLAAEKSAEPAPPLPIEQLFSLPNIRQPKLSPDGKKIAFLSPIEKKMALGIFDRATKESRIILRGEDESIYSFFW